MDYNFQHNVNAPRPQFRSKFSQNFGQQQNVVENVDDNMETYDYDNDVCPS